MAAGASDPGGDLERLLAEVDQALGTGRPPAAPGRPADREPVRAGGHPLASRLSRSLVIGAGAAALVWALFAVLPFLQAVSGAAGAFIGGVVGALLGALLRR